MKKFLALALLLLASVAKAQTFIPVINGSFEQGAAVSGGVGTGGPWSNQVPAGWTKTGSGNSGLWTPDSTVCGYKSIPDGSTVVWNDGATFTQDLGVAVVTNNIYSVTAYVGHRGCQGTSTYSISLLAGDTVLCSWSGTNSTIPINTFNAVTNSCPILTDQSGDLKVSFTSFGTEADFDNVSVSYTSSVPVIPNVVLNINSGSVAVYDDGSPILPGDVLVGQLQTPTSNIGIGTISSDTAGNLSGSITVNTNWVDANGNLTFVFGLPVVPNAVVYPVPVGEFQHGSTGLTINLVLFKQGPLGIKSQTLAVTP